MFLAHYVGGGLDEILTLDTSDFWAYFDEALKLYENEAKLPRRTILAGIEKK